MAGGVYAARHFALRKNAAKVRKNIVKVCRNAAEGVRRRGGVAQKCARRLFDNKTLYYLLPAIIHGPPRTGCAAGFNLQLCI